MQETMYEQVMAQLDAHKGTLKEIADESGVPLSTVTRIARRETLNPYVHAIEDLHRCFLKRGRSNRPRKGRDLTRSAAQ